MELLEREEALARLRGALSEACGGGGLIAFVSGEAGIGKTSLLRAFVAGVPDDVRLVIGGCDDLAVPRALGPFHEIADGLPALATRLDEEPAAAPRLVLEELRRTQPSVCVVEDAHWADEATLDVLGYVARRIEDLAALLVVSLRDDELDVAHPLRRVLAAAAPDRACRVVLEPLSVGAVRLLAGPGLDAQALHEVTGGNPFFVTEAISAGTGLSATLRDAVLSRVARLSDEGRAVAELVSVVPGQAEPWLVESLAASPVEGLVACEAGGLLAVEAGNVRFRHELARRAVEDALAGARRRELNRAVLAALTARGVDAARLAHHAREAGDARRARAPRSHGRAPGRGRRCPSRGVRAAGAAARAQRARARDRARRRARAALAGGVPACPPRSGHPRAAGGARHPSRAR